ncbi:hypothetical protein I4U23_001525 [Adineta vaga]|nr:hypothetical protein I4U23_001525 [Adineta vaga]
MILLLICFLGFIQSVTSIQCYTCNEPGFFCSLPLNVDGGDDSNENDINNPHYGYGFVCQSDHYIDLRTGREKLILRGTKHCENLNIVNHRTFCCNTNNCNKWLPNMKRRAYIPSNTQRHLSSMVLIGFSIITQYYLFI